MAGCANEGAWIVACSLLATAACVDTAGDVRDASSDGFTIEPPGDGAPSGDAHDDGGAGVATKFRVAHLSNDLGAIDICYRPASSQAWEGPLFVSTDAGAPTPMDASVDASASDAAVADGAARDAGDGSASGFRFGAVTRYVTALASGTFDLALVAAGDASCARPLALGHVTLDAGKLATVVVMGLARVDAGSPSALAIVAFTDDATVSAEAARARFIHAAPGAAGGAAATLSISAMSGGNVITLAARIEPGHAATPSEAPPRIDALGYGSAAPLTSSGALRVASVSDGGGPTWTTSGADLRMSASSVHTGFVFDASGAGDLAVLWCDDRSVALLSTPCTILR